MFKKKIGGVHSGTLGRKKVEDDIKMIIFLTVVRLCLINIHSDHECDEQGYFKFEIFILTIYWG